MALHRIQAKITQIQDLNQALVTIQTLAKWTPEVDTYQDDISNLRTRIAKLKTQIDLTIQLAKTTIHGAKSLDEADAYLNAQLLVLNKIIVATDVNRTKFAALLKDKLDRTEYDTFMVSNNIINHAAEQGRADTGQSDTGQADAGQADAKQNKTMNHFAPLPTNGSTRKRESDGDVLGGGGENRVQPPNKKQRIVNPNAEPAPAPASEPAPAPAPASASTSASTSASASASADVDADVDASTSASASTSAPASTSASTSAPASASTSASTSTSAPASAHAHTPAPTSTLAQVQTLAEKTKSEAKAQRTRATLAWQAVSLQWERDGMSRMQIDNKKKQWGEEWVIKDQSNTWDLWYADKRADYDKINERLRIIRLQETHSRPEIEIIRNEDKRLWLVKNPEPPGNPNKKQTRK